MRHVATSPRAWACRLLPHGLSPFWRTRILRKISLSANPYAPPKLLPPSVLMARQIRYNRVCEAVHCVHRASVLGRRNRGPFPPPMEVLRLGSRRFAAATLLICSASPSARTPPTLLKTPYAGPPTPTRHYLNLMSTASPPDVGFIDRQLIRTPRSLKLLDASRSLLTLLLGVLMFLLAAAVVDHWLVPGGLGHVGQHHPVFCAGGGRAVVRSPATSAPATCDQPHLRGPRHRTREPRPQK